MDCRKFLWFGFSLVMTGALGCTHEPIMPQGPTLGGPPQVDATPLPEKELPRKTPKPRTLVTLGNLKEHNGDAVKALSQKEQLYDQARKNYQQALEVDPDNKEALQALAHLYTIIKDHDRALATYERALKVYPNDGPLWYALGMYQSQCKDWESAIASLGQAAVCDPENKYYSNHLGYCLARSGRFDESFACFEKTVGPGQAHYNLARMLLHLNQEAQCKDHLRLALQADPQLDDARTLLTQLDGGVAAPPSTQLSNPEQGATGTPAANPSHPSLNLEGLGN
jgi:tetratricopeptide (TPR) repeat protein